MRGLSRPGVIPGSVLLLAFYLAAAGLQAWMRPPDVAPTVVAWSIYLGVGPALITALLVRSGAWLVVFFGALSAQVLVHGTASVPLADEMTLVQSDLVVAAGAALQAVLGARLIRGVFGVPLRLERKRAIAVLCVIAGPVVGVFGFLATCCSGLVYGLSLGGDVFIAALIGSIVGMISTYIFLPLALVSPWRDRSLLIWKGSPLSRMSLWAQGCIALSLILSIALWAAANLALERSNRQQFEAMVQDGTQALYSRLTAYDFGVDAAAAMIRASDSVTDMDWRRLADEHGIGGHLPGAGVIGYLRQIAPRDLEAFVAQTRAEGDGSFTLHPAATEPGARIILRHISPQALRPSLSGLELGNDPDIRRTAERARDAGTAMLTNRLDPAQPGGKAFGPGFMLLDPVYVPGMPTGDVAARRRALLGWTFLVFTRDALTAGLQKGLTRDMTLKLQIGDEIAAQARKEAGGTAGGGLLFQTSGGQDLPSVHIFSVAEHLHLFGQPWNLVWTSTPAYAIGLHRFGPALILVGGLAFTALLAAFLLSNARREELIKQTVVRKTREIAQREAETRSILDTALVMIAMVDGEGRILTANDAIGRTFGFHPDRLPGTMLNDLMAGAASEYFARSVSTNDRTGFRSLVQVSSRTGENLALEVQIKPWQTAEGARRHTVVMRNIADRLRVERQLRDTQHRLDVALKGAMIGVFDLDLKTGEEIVSDTWLELMGFDREAQVNTRTEWNMRIHPDDRDRVADADNACINGESDASVSEYRIQLANGEWHWMRSHAVVAECDESGRAVRLIGVQMDVTEERMLDQAKSEFVSTVSHELRTPLTSINGSLSLALNTSEPGAIPERVLRLLQIAQKNCDRLIPLVNDILDLEKVASGQTRFDFSDEDIAELLHRAVADNAPYASQFGVTVEHFVSEGGLMGRVDANRFLQVMTNLLANAVKFSERGGRVAVHLAQGQETLRISVTDHGRGIPASFHDRIFQPFSQADSSSTRDKDGTGLGLNISKQIVERMGGAIGFQSDPGRETTFWFTVPRSRRAEQAGARDGALQRPARAKPVPASAMAAQIPAATGLSMPVILHVEDDIDFAEIVAASFGETAELVHSDREFSLEALRGGRRFDLILLESAQAEGADALLMDAVERLQPGVPIIALTASDKSESDQRVTRTIIKTRTRFDEIVSLCLAEISGPETADETQRKESGPVDHVVG